MTDVEAGPSAAAAPPAALADDARSGILSMLAAVALMAVMNAVSKLLADGYSLAEIAFFRNLFALLPATAMVAAAGGATVLRTAHPLGHLWRSLIGLTSMVLLFWSYRLLPLADAVAISYSAPLFLTALSVPLLGERVGPVRWGAVALGFAGVAVIAQPGGSVEPGALVALAAAVAYALAQIAMRQLGRTERPVTTVFHFTALSTVLCALALPFAWTTPSARDLALMAVMGLAGGASQHFITRAYARAPAALVSPFGYTGIVWAALFGWLLWGDAPAPHVVAGTAIIVAGGLVILIREARRAPTPR
ncbi:DMT family transporter [Azospirillum sp. ST 5-10]|uniref:DMT family transporter n=1 Tax=unclassified Azospirillum TaxID=2630922 RepID=UPI003F49BCF2